MAEILFMLGNETSLPPPPPRPKTRRNYKVLVRTSFGLNPKTGMDLGPQSLCNKFVECRVKSQSGSRTKILGYNVKEKELCIRISIKSIIGHAPMLIFGIFFSPLSFLPPFSYILWILYLFPRPRVDWAFPVLFLHSSCLFLNLPSLTGRLRVHCSGITSTLMRPEGQLGGI